MSQRPRPARAHHPDPADHPARRAGDRPRCCSGFSASCSRIATAARACCNQAVRGAAARLGGRQGLVLPADAAAATAPAVTEQPAGAATGSTAMSQAAAQPTSRRPPQPVGMGAGARPRAPARRGPAGRTSSSSATSPRPTTPASRTPSRPSRRDVRRRGPGRQGRVRLRARAQRLRQEHDPAADRRPGAAASGHRAARCWCWASRSAGPGPIAAWSFRTTPASTTAPCSTTSPSAWSARACRAGSATSWAGTGSSASG